MYAGLQEGDWAGLIDRFERDKTKRADQLAKMQEERDGEERGELEEGEEGYEGEGDQSLYSD